jgi:hypothetical protein
MSETDRKQIDHRMAILREEDAVVLEQNQR